MSNSETPDAMKVRQVFDHFDADDSGGLDKKEQRLLSEQMVRPVNGAQHYVTCVPVREGTTKSPN